MREVHGVSRLADLARQIVRGTYFSDCPHDIPLRGAALSSYAFYGPAVKLIVPCLLPMGYVPPSTLQNSCVPRSLSVFLCGWVIRFIDRATLPAYSAVN